MAKSNIDKLIELKQLYEQGILTKEEMETEKQKILGSTSNAPTSEPSQTTGHQSYDADNKDSVGNSVKKSSKSFFTKNNKLYLFCGILLLLVIGGVYFVLMNVGSDTTVIPTDTVEIKDVKPIALKGMINDKIGFTMHLTISGDDVEGTEHYASQRKDVNVMIKGINGNNGKLVLYEYDGNTKAGTFEGTIMGETYSGTFTNSKGKTFSFSANILTESALSKIEEEEKQFETTKIEYKKNTSSSIVELSVDYPIKGTDALLKNTREYISGVIAAMFSINKYEGSLNDGNSVINSYGKTKYFDLDKEWNEDDYEGGSAYMETIEFVKDFENDYCVSLCAHSHYFHGGVGNSFCDAATFRKADGKCIKIIRSENNKELHKLIIRAVKNKLGQDYEMVNENFESSPVAGIIHLVKNGVQFDYQHYEIGPGALSQVSITIPYEKIKPYMTEEAKNILNE